MFDMSWGEIMVIGGVALIVIGPKDLPRALRTVGQMTTKVRRMAGEFQAQFSEAMREAELDDVRKEVEGLNRDVASATSTAFNPIQTIREEIKGAVEPRPNGAGASSAYDPVDPALPPPSDWTAGQSELTAGPVQDHAAPQPASAFDEPAMPDPIVPALPPLADPAVAASFPETQPLVPLPVDEPVLPAPPANAGHAAPADIARDHRP